MLASHAYQLTDDNMYYFPGHFLRHWSTDKKLPYSAKDNLLLAMGRMLASRDKDWWSPDGGPPAWPTEVLIECAEKEDAKPIQSSAAVLLAALHDCFPRQFGEFLSPARLKPILKQAAEAEVYSVPNEYLSLADEVRRRLGIPAVVTDAEGMDMPLGA